MIEICHTEQGEGDFYTSISLADLPDMSHLLLEKVIYLRATLTDFPRIMVTFKNIPAVPSYNTTDIIWFGDMAKFILFNLKSAKS